MTVYETCYETYGNDVNSVVECVADWVDNDGKYNKNTLVSWNELNSWLLIICGALVFFMQIGFAMLCAGAVRKKNITNTYVIDIKCVSATVRNATKYRHEYFYVLLQEC